MKGLIILTTYISTTIESQHVVDNWDICNYNDDCNAKGSQCCPISQKGTNLPQGKVLKVCGPITSVKVLEGSFIGWDFTCPNESLPTRGEAENH